MKLAAVVVWYNPSNITNIIENIKSYADFLEKVYIVDNSSTNNSELAEKLSNAVYIPNFKNLGIAAAQNIGCDHAIKDGFDWVITMDQDSRFLDGDFEKYKVLAESYSIQEKNVASFSPNMCAPDKKQIAISILIKNQIKKCLGLYKNNFPNAQKSDVEYVKRVIASGNIINLNIWNSIGKFDEAFFIDEVDHEFCIRLFLNNFKIVRFNNVYLKHSLGTRKRTFFPKCTYHNNFRLFYIFRNKLIVFKRYGKNPEIHDLYRHEIWGYIRDYCIRDFKAPKYWITFLRAYLAYRKFIKQDPICQKLH